MSHQKKRSKLTINAIMQAAATGQASDQQPPRKLAAIAGLAGFVLRLFRSRETLPVVHRGGTPPRRRGRPKKTASMLQQGSSQAVRTQGGSEPSALTSQSSLMANSNKGGNHHG